MADYDSKEWEVVFDAAACRAKEFIELELVSNIGDVVAQCESPIERRFLAGLWGYSILNGLWLQAYFTEAKTWVDLDFATTDPRVRVTPQWKRGRCRHDFHLEYSSLVSTGGALEQKPLATLIVECDGHEYHERTKEQARRDRSRDRVAVAEGHTVLRFTGSELHRDALGCAGECVQILMNNARRREVANAE